MTPRYSLLTVLVCLLLLGTHALPAGAGPNDLTAAEAITVEQWSTQTQSLAQQIEAEAAALDNGAARATVNHRLNEVVARLSHGAQVSTGPGMTLAVNTDWARDQLLAAMQAPTAHLQVRRMRDLAHRLRLLAELGEPRARRHFSGDARALAADILATPEFAGRKAGPLDRLAELVTQILARLAEIIFGGLVGKSAWEVASAVGLILLAIAILLVILIILRRLTIGHRRRWEPAAAEHKPLPPDASAALRQALQAMEAGNVKESLRLLHLALLLALAASGVLDFNPSRTNWEYVRLLVGRPEGETLSRATTLFERKYFGRQPCSAQELALLRGWAEDALGETG